MRYVKRLFRASFDDYDGFCVAPLIYIAAAVAIIERLAFTDPPAVLVILSAIIALTALAICCIANFKNKRKVAGIGFLFAFFGVAMNFAVISLNNWRMPVITALEDFLEFGLSSRHIYFEWSSQKLLWFSDRIRIGKSLASPGDFAILLSSIIIVGLVIKRHIFGKKNKKKGDRT